MSTPVDDRFQQALQAGTLYQLAKTLKAEGMSQREMYILFDRHRAAHERDVDEALHDAILDTMDTIDGWCDRRLRLFDEDLKTVWYRDWRQPVEAFFADPNVIHTGENECHSPLGRYRLIVRDYSAEPDGYSRGLVYAGERLIGDVKRNNGIFHHGWAEAHHNGHDYLLCGEDSLGQTVIELDSGRRADHAPGAAGAVWAGAVFGFCCTAYYPSPDRKLIAMDGCYKGHPHQLLLCHFDDPMALPWSQIERIGPAPKALGWTDEGFVYELSMDIRISDGKPFGELTDGEEIDFSKRRKEIGGRRIRRYVRLANGDKRLLEEHVEQL